MTKTRALFLLPSLEGGGAERVFITLLKHVSRQTFELHLAVLDRCGTFLGEIPPDVTLHDLQSKRVSRGCLKLLRTVWQVRPQVVISTTTHLNIAAAMLRPLMPAGTRLFLRETIVSDHLAEQRMLGMLGQRRIGTLYRMADAVVCQSDFMRAELIASFGVPHQKLVRIYNPIDFHRLDQQARQDGQPLPFSAAGPNVVAVGNLLPVKGFDRLIGSFRELVKAKPLANLWILGQGPLQQQLKDLAARQGIGGHVHFPGFQPNPFRWLRHADLFVLSSRFESAPNALLEAIACGCPVIALDHRGGTAELLRRVDLASRMVKSLVPWQEPWFERPPQAASTLAREHFDVGKIVRRYTSVLTGRAPELYQRQAA